MTRTTKFETSPNIRAPEPMRRIPRYSLKRRLEVTVENVFASERVKLIGRCFTRGSYLTLGLLVVAGLLRFAARLFSLATLEDASQMISATRCFGHCFGSRQHHARRFTLMDDLFRPAPYSLTALNNGTKHRAASDHMPRAGGCDKELECELR